MPDYCSGCLLIGILLISNCTVAVAGGDNPWRIDTPYEHRQSLEKKSFDTYGNSGTWDARNGGSGSGTYFDLDQNGLQSLPRAEMKRERQLLSGPDRSVSQKYGSTVLEPRIIQGGEFVERPRYEESEEVRERQSYEFGYSGAGQFTADGRPNARTWSDYGIFPPLEGAGKKAEAQEQGIQFEGRSYGAFPPLEHKSAQENRLRDRSVPPMGQAVPRSQFANVSPPPVHAPWPEAAYPYGGYAFPPGYGAGFPGLSVPPLMMGAGMPWLLW